MNGQVVLRLLDTYFRHKWLYLVPVVLLGGQPVVVEFKGAVLPVRRKRRGIRSVRLPTALHVVAGGAGSGVFC